MFDFKSYKLALEDDSFDLIYKMINSCNTPYILDEKGLDILHHAIIANYTEAVRLIFLKGWFKDHQPKCNSYLHLACHLGFWSIVTILIQERPRDYKLSGNVCYPDDCELMDKTTVLNGASGDTCINHPGQLKHTSPLLAVEFAALAGHHRCVEAYFNYHLCSHTCFIECACELNCPVSVQLLLKTNEFTQKQMSDALHIALCSKQARCLDALLAHGAKPEEAFRGMNLYHVLYMYSYGYGRGLNRFEGIVETTRILIQHNVDVNSFEPPGTFPLYSLLNSIETVLEMSSNDDVSVSQLIQCLNLLLSAGANPNFNEQENASEDLMSQAHGRRLFSSGISCLFNVVNTTRHLATSILYKLTRTVCKILIDFKATPSIVDKSRGFNAFHDACFTLGTTGLKHNFAILKMLMKHGGDPDGVTHQGHFPVCIYTTALFSNIESREGTHTRCNDDTMRSIHGLYGYMETNNVLKAFKCAQNALSNGLGFDPGILNSCFKVRSLQFICQVKIWKCLNRDITKLSVVNLPSALKRSIAVDIFEDEEFSE